MSSAEHLELVDTSGNFGLTYYISGKRDGERASPHQRK